MDKITKDKIIESLKKINPKAKASDLVIYVDAYAEYTAAQANITEHGSIVFHPRTGSPIENPYIKIRNGASSTIRKMTNIKSVGLWDA